MRLKKEALYQLMLAVHMLFFQDQLLTELIQEMIDTNTITERELAGIAEWYLVAGSDTFCALADTVFQTAPEDVCVALEDAIIKLQPTENTRRLLCTLISRVPADSPEISDNLRSELMNWIVADNVSQLLPFCNASLRRFNDQQMKELLCDTLEGTQGQTLSQIQIGILNTALDRLVQGRIHLSRNQYALLDSRISEYDSALINTAVAYLLQVRLSEFCQIPDASELCAALASKSANFRKNLEEKSAKKRYFHSIFHIFCVFGSIAHLICILFYVLV